MKRYFQVAILNQAIEPLTYSFTGDLDKHFLVQVSLRGKKTLGVVVQECDKPSFKCLEILFVCTGFYSSFQMQMSQFISKYYVSYLGNSLGLFMPFLSPSDKKEPISLDLNLSLSKTQEKAYEFLQQNQISLLFGDTASGKTEIYIKLIAQTLQNAKTAIFLMPEIALTPQMQKRLQEHFGDLLCVWHSKLSAKIKEKALFDIDSQRVKIVVGARSALFLPLKNLGLIIVDEEHDESFKSSKSPMYNARDLSVYFAHKSGIKAVLGSATPSMTSYKKFTSFRLRGQYFTAKKDFIFLDKQELDFEILELLKQNKKNKKQSIVFVPTRANYKTLICKDCQSKILCPFCNVSLSLHSKTNSLRCHYCGYVQRIVKECPNCQSDMLEGKRIGTAEITNLLTKNGINAQQFDSDTVSTQRALTKKLKDFKDQKIDALVGTQMLSKSHNYFNVSLAVIVGIDYILEGSDYKSEEKALSLLLQIAGRAGRNADAKIIVLSKNAKFFERYTNDYEDFLKDFYPKRANLYPPFKKLARLLFENQNPNIAMQNMQKALNLLKQTKVEIVGSGECQISKINNKFRFFILIRHELSSQIELALRQVKHLDLSIDVDPTNFL